MPQNPAQQGVVIHHWKHGAAPKHSNRCANCHYCLIQWIFYGKSGNAYGSGGSGNCRRMATVIYSAPATAQETMFSRVADLRHGVLHMIWPFISRAPDQAAIGRVLK